MTPPDPAKRRATLEDLAEVPEHLVGEIIDGVLETSPRPSPPHAVAHSGLQSLVGGPFGFGAGGGPGGWWILTEPELHLGPDVLVPDLAGWRRERMPEMPETAWFELAPDWICEVVSPSTARIDRVRKLPIYAREAVAWAWLLDPLAESLEVFQLVDGSWVLHTTHASDEVVRAEPFTAVELPLSLLWGREAPAAG